ncbi:MAG: glycoside hydrolase family 95 protein [Defluviitaleaceae bacterium]|nr:glycoside hydrolase family 95 protein [Defluviitaleaceae bacterium]
MLWYKRPARKWIQGMPLGNGRLGAMIQGKMRNETIVLNDDTVWAKVAEKRNNPDAAKYLPQIRQLLLDGQVEKAANLAEASMIGIPRRQSPYQVLGELNLIFTDHPDTPSEDYRRELDIETAISTVSYSLKGTKFNREHFVSGADGVFATRLTTSKKSSINLMVTLFRRFDASVKVLSPKRIIMQGQCGIMGTKFATLLDVDAPGGTVTAIGSYLHIEGADEVILTLTSETNIRTEDYVKACEERICIKHNYQQLKSRHLEDYQNYYNRMSFTLKGDEESNELPTDERLALLRKGNSDLSLISLYFNFGRYLLISSSRPGSMPANLQGIWNDSYAPPWDSKFTININTEMNYWPAEPCGLGDCHTPLFDMLNRARENGKETANQMYNAKGFVIHHNLDMWCDTAPLDSVRSGIWPMGGAWLSYHLWEHYKYTNSLSFLDETAYPIMKEAAEFLLDYMFEDENGQLISGPSMSPENRYILPDGQVGYICLSPAMDTQIVQGLFARVLEAAKILGLDDDFTAQVKSAIPKLPPMKIGKNGGLQEWLHDHEDGEPGHRHISHLFAVYPDNQINESTPELYRAARHTLEERIKHGSGGTGWSEAWIIALWARFKEGNLAFEAVETLLKDLTEDSLLDIHPPGIFQIDGNLGAVAGMLEMLVQQNDETIILMPALPSAWTDGDVRGIRLKGNIILDITWSNGIVKAFINGETNKKISLQKGIPYILEV